MLESVLIAGLTIAIVEAIKRSMDLPDYLYFIPVMVIATALNAGNAYLFGAGIMTMQEAIVEGIRVGATIAGIYGLGKPIVEQAIK